MITFKLNTNRITFNKRFATTENIRFFSRTNLNTKPITTNRRKIKNLTILLIIVIFTNCSLQKEIEPFSINENEIISINIRKKFDNLGVDLNRNETKKNLQTIKNNKYQGPTKYIKKYFIDIKLNNDSMIKINANNVIFSISDFKAYKMTSSNTFDSLWDLIEGDKREMTLFRPIILINNNLNVENYSESLMEVELISIKQVLDFYEIENRIVGMNIYYDGEIDKETLWNYTIKSRDENWLQTHK